MDLKLSSSPGCARRLTVLMVAPRRTHQGGVTRAIDAWLAAGLTDHVDVEILRMVAWDASLPIQLFQACHGLLNLATRLARPAGRPDVVHVHTSSGGSLYRKYLASWVARRADVPVIVHLHSGGFEEWKDRRRIHSRTAERLFSSAAVVVVLAETWRELAEELGARQIRVIPHLLGPWLANLLAAVPAGGAGDSRDGLVTLLYYGRWAPIKGLDVLAAAIGGLPAVQQQRLRLRVFGNGDADWLRRSFEGTQLAELCINGWLADEDKPGELSKADAVVLPSRSEAFASSLLEVMAASVRLIASDAGAIPDVVGAYPQARLTRRGDSGDLRDALGALLDGSWPDQPTTTASLPEKYSADTVVAELVNVYRLTAGA